MLFGLGAAFGFGLADLFGAISTRRVGVPVTLFVIQVVDVVLLALLLLTPLPGALSANLAARVAIVVAGVLGTVSFFSFYRALQLGPVAVVSPVFAAYAAIAVLLSVVLHGERLSAMASTGVVLTIAGVVLASARGDADAGGVRSWGGIPFALVATFAWGVASYLIGRYAQQTGWFVPVFGMRLVEFVLVGGVLLILRARGTALVAPRGRTVVFPAVSAVSDAVAVSMFARGSELGLVSVASAVSATFPLVVIAGGLILFHERPSTRQWLGVVSAIAGLILLGLGR